MWPNAGTSPYGPAILCSSRLEWVYRYSGGRVLYTELYLGILLSIRSEITLQPSVYPKSAQYIPSCGNGGLF
eukprot:scaffold3083_cov440-Prasinococcus_capsulatus_cf.AAC.3